MSAARLLPAPAEAVSLAPTALPTAHGAYQWFYVDARAFDVTLVVLFMVGSPFSRRYAAAPGAPARHSAVNLAVYRSGAPVAWVLTEYSDARLETAGDSTRLRIGRSALTWRPDGRVHLEVDEREPGRRGRRLRMDGEISPRSPRLPAIPLGEGQRWEGLALRAAGSFSLPELSLGLRGPAYFDSNAGDEPLGVSLPGWRWTRALGSGDTRVLFQLPGGDGVLAFANDHEASWRRVSKIAPVPANDRRTRWGLAVPRRLELAPGAPARLLESSPFYARLEASTPAAHVLSEVADFRRFRSPLVRWMADFRTRREAP